VDLHVVVSDDSLVQEGADQEENLPGAFQSAALLNHLRSEAVQVDQLLLRLGVKAELDDNIAPKKVHLEREGVGFKGVTIVLQEGDGALQWQCQDYFLIHTTVGFAAIGEAADEILIKQQLLHFLIDSNVF
jgi:hypothetical protein